MLKLVRQEAQCLVKGQDSMLAPSGATKLARLSMMLPLCDALPEMVAPAAEDWAAGSLHMRN